jgi:4-diphosphocytidyl-2-C-methyl-D-erythritol kinase
LISPAKINLGLKILYKRQDGFHELQSIFLLIDWGDEIHIEDSEDFILQSELDPNLPRKEDFENVSERGDITKNILYKTYLKAKTLQPNIKGVKISLKKRIPTGGGLGGGSSNAAQLLKYFFQTKFSHPFNNEFYAISSTIGADVPFFLVGKSSIVGGIGEKMEIFELPQFFGILAIPPFGINTKEAFISLKKPLQESIGSNDWRYLSSDVKNPLLDGNLSKFHSLIANDFEPFATKVYPELSKLKKSMLEFGMDFVTMSGSGSCFYGLVTNEDKIPKIMEHLKSSFREFQFVSFKTQ